VQWSCGYSCGRVAPGGAQLSCATPRNSVAQLTATPPQLVRNSAATRPQLLTATVSGRRCRVFTTPRGAASLHTDLEKAWAKFRSDSYALAARGFVGKLVATVAQLRRNCCATRPQLGRNSSQLSCATPRNSRATRELRNCCATVASCVTWSVTWTDGCAPEAARRPGDSRTGVSLPATLHHNMLSVLRTIGIVGHLMA
jgi:hypothetical protein